MKTEAKQRTCEERLPEHLAGRMEDLRDLIERMASGDREEVERAQAEADEYGLSLTVTRVLRWDLSTGGPGDWLEFHIDEHDDVVRVEYVFQDWFDGARATLQGDDLKTTVDFYEYNLRHYVECL